ncbi:hypothetical protein WPS_22160 [Vulcanimicrobium alpinum]|uniref:Histidine kinase/HSP90-like ATPase domain-containing protein n=1 Tax=Vulcanimicrobium alpinum TaxID=3016050 RepID=A0AAN1XXW7_UNVUL|nr:ATP-binding protein [Vulcanimicrobium alpinum]BDE06940.1 hypothetical protein WPS_22160 [Vulcanimicrobium alpinum]
MLIVRVIAVDELDLQFSATASNSHRARYAVQRVVDDCEFEPARGADFVLAVAEAMNNAAEHAYHDRSGDVRVVMRAHHGELIATITDRGRWRLTPTPDRGRGLSIMRALAERCDVSSDERGTTVTLAVSLAQRGRARA